LGANEIRRADRIGPGDDQPGHVLTLHRAVRFGLRAEFFCGIPRLGFGKRFGFFLKFSLAPGAVGPSICR